jgi:hypothetical protein
MLTLLLLVAAFAGVLVTGGVTAGWLLLVVVVVAGPVLVVVDARARAQASQAPEGAPLSEPDRLPSSARPAERPYRAAA